MSGRVLDVVKYGSVDLVIEENRHRFETRMTFDRWAGAIGGLVGMAVVAFVLTIAMTDPVFPWLEYTMAGFMALVSLPAIYISLFRKVVLSFTPDRIALRIRGTLPLSRPGNWTWRLEQFAGVAIDTMPFVSRGSRFLRYAVNLEIQGSDNPRKLFFVFDSREWAEALQKDITTSWRFMVERHNARLGALQEGPSSSDDPVHS